MVSPWPRGPIRPGSRPGIPGLPDGPGRHCGTGGLGLEARRREEHRKNEREAKQVACRLPFAYPSPFHSPFLSAARKCVQLITKH